MAEGWFDLSADGGWPWEGLAPGPQLAAVLAEVDGSSLPGQARVSLLRACEALAGWVAVRSAHALVDVADAVQAAAGDRGAATSSSSWVGEEVGAALRLAPRTAVGRVAAAWDLVRRWPVLGEQVASGVLTWGQARVVAEGVAVLAGCLDAQGRDLAQVAVQRLLWTAHRYPPARLRERVTACVLALDPAAAARRRRRAVREESGVSWWSEPDGMGCVAVRGAAPDLLRLREAIHAHARHAQTAASAAGSTAGSAGDAEGAGGVEFTVGQWRVAAVLDAFGLPSATYPTTPTPAAGSGPGSDASSGAAPDAGAGCGRVGFGRPVVGVVVDLATLLDLADAPGQLPGYGPIDPDLARALAGDADWVRWVSDPVTGHLLDEGTRRFPGARLARFIQARDARCSHPGCGARSARCDVDHVPAYRDGGSTRADRLAATCPKHNRGRDAAGWTAVPDPITDPYAGPEPVWTSPLGRTYRTTTTEVLPHPTGPSRPPPDEPPF
ncbi:MAG: DUF222 domain-containing protein [Candidatus Nanopelagicales bacterium]